MFSFSTSGRNAQVVLEDISKTAFSLGLISKPSVSLIPEVNLQAGSIVTEIIKTMMEASDSEGSQVDPTIIMMWCAFAGIGGALLWNDEFEVLRDRPLLDVLIEKRGFDFLDEYVLDQIGKPIESPEGLKLGGNIKILGMKANSDNSKALKNNGELFVKQFVEIGKAMFYFGVGYGLEVRGLK